MNKPYINESVGGIGGNAHVSHIYSDDEVLVTVPRVGCWRVRVTRLTNLFVGWMRPTLWIIPAK